MRKLSIGFVGAALLVGHSATAHAQYFGGVRLNAPPAALLANATDLLFGARFFTVANKLESDALAVKFGYRFSVSHVPHLALVGQYAEIKRLREQSLLFGGTQTQKSYAYGLDLVGTLPLTSRFAVSGNAGVAQVRTNSIFGGAVPTSLSSTHDNRYTAAARAGLGLQYDVNRSLGFQFGVERYRNLNRSSFNGSGTGNDGDGDSYTFGVRIRF